VVKKIIQNTKRKIGMVKSTDIVGELVVFDDCYLEKTKITYEIISCYPGL